MSDTKKKEGVFSDFEKEAMRNRAKELKAEEKATRTRKDGENDVQAAIAAMLPGEQVMARKIHEIVSKVAPQLFPKTWYGMPAYAKEDGKAILFFQPGQKFQARYSTLGFNDGAKLDEGDMWPAAYALMKIGAKEEEMITKLVKKSIS